MKTSMYKKGKQTSAWGISFDVSVFETREEGIKCGFCDSPYDIDKDAPDLVVPAASASNDTDGQAEATKKSKASAKTKKAKK